MHKFGYAGMFNQTIDITNDSVTINDKLETQCVYCEVWNEFYLYLFLLFFLLQTVKYFHVYPDNMTLMY